MKRVAYFGGTFDPVHNGHLSIARALVEYFRLDRFFFLPAFHAPHKQERAPTSAFHRYAMLCLATSGDERLAVTTLELERGEKRYTTETLPELQALEPTARSFFVMGADSWQDIRTWREWEQVLLTSDHIIVTRPGFEITFDHVTDVIRKRIVDLRNGKPFLDIGTLNDRRIYITDAVNHEISATDLREDLSDGALVRTQDIPTEVAKYIEKYELYS